MAKFCLPHSIANDFLASFKDGRLDINKLADENISSAKRRKMFSDVVGINNAAEVNAKFEAALVSRQKTAFTNFIKKMGGLSKPLMNDMLAKVQKIEGLLKPTEQKALLEDLIRTKLKINVNPEEAKNIAALAKKLGSITDKNSMSYGYAKDDFENYVASLKPSTDNAFTKIGGFTKSLQATADLSAPFRQGRGYFGSMAWNGAFSRMLNYAKDPAAYRELRAKIYSDPLYDMAKKAKVDLTALGSQPEEQFMSTWVNKLPLIKGSERAYSGFLTDLRFNRFKDLYNNLAKNGIGLSEKELQDLGTAINSGTGRGNLGSFNVVAQPLSEAIFSPKFLKSRLDMINPAYYIKLSGPARKEAIGVLVRTASTTAILMGLAKAAGAPVEVNPFSSNFGKYKVGNSWIDLTGGYGAPIRVAFQALGSMVKDKSGQLKDIGTGKYGEQTPQDVVVNFLTGKEAPLLSLATDIFGRKENFNYEPEDIKNPKTYPTISKDIISRFVPLIGQDIYQMYQDGGMKEVGLDIIPSLLGANVNVQTPKK